MTSMPVELNLRDIQWTTQTPNQETHLHAASAARWKKNLPATAHGVYSGLDSCYQHCLLIE